MAVESLSSRTRVVEGAVTEPGPDGHAPPALDRLNWRTIGGVLGLAWLALFVVGGIVLMGDTPTRSDSVTTIREFFADNKDQYLAGDYVVGVAFTLFFLPFIVALRNVLSEEGAWPTFLARISFYAGLATLIWGGLAAVSWGALALGAERFDDSSIRLLMEVDAYAYAGVLLLVGLFMGATGAAIWMSRSLWRWLGIVGLLGFVGSYIGGAWPINGDDEGAIAAFGLAGFVGVLPFVLLVCVNLLLTRHRSADS